MDNAAVRSAIVAYCQRMFREGYLVRAAGNVSVRLVQEEAMLITPSGLAYDSMKPEDIIQVQLGTWESQGPHKASREYLMHGMIYQARPEVTAVLHTHATYSSVLSVARKPLPPILGILKRGGAIPVAEYGPTGSPALAANALKALGQKDAVILANHGAICVGADLSSAYAMCELLEWASRIYIMANSLGPIFEIETA